MCKYVSSIFQHAFRYAYRLLTDKADWFLRADDQTYIVMENLRFMLGAYSLCINFGFSTKLSYDVITIAKK